MKKIILAFTTALASLSLVSCKDWLDINYSPNSPSADIVTADMIFPAAEMALASCYGDQFYFMGSYLSEHVTQYFGTSNYLSYSQFTVSQSATNVRYQYMNIAIANATEVRNKAAEAGEWGTYLAATTIRVFAYQVLADAYGEVSYSEAMQGKDNLSPKYDEGQDIYAGLVAELDDALSKVSAGDAVTTNFLFQNYNDASEWIKFANALKLKILMREHAVVDVKAQLTALVSEGNFPTSDVAWDGIWADEAGKANPLYQEEVATYFGSTQTNICLNVALLRTMQASNDNRLGRFFKTNDNGEYWGGISGYNMSTSANYKSPVCCPPNLAYDDPVNLITVSEVEFFLSEYYRKVAGNESAAKEHYEAAVRASFSSAGVSGADAVLRVWPYDGTDKSLGVQKWVALSGTNGFEAWCELRRLGYPAFGGLNAENIYNFTTDELDATKLTAGELYTPYQVYTEIGENSLVQRFPYALSSTNYNTTAPEVKKSSVKVFWAK